MIFTRKDLQEYLKRDNLGFGSQTFYKRMIKRLGGYENYYIYELFRVLRHYEFYLNLEKRTLLERVFLLYWKYRYNHSRIKSNMFVAPNTFGPGVMIVHLGFLRCDSWIHIGENCTVLPNVLFGKRNAMNFGSKCSINVGNNVYISVGAIILGPITIGDNVVIGAGSVVNKDITNNVIVAGVPAKQIGFTLSTN